MHSMELEELKRRIAELEKENSELRKHDSTPENRDSVLPSIHALPSDHSGSRSVSDHSLNPSQVERYSRHLVLDAFGIKAQERLCTGSVLVIGSGGLGSSALLYLAGSGVGKIGIVDRDTVSLSNLHRQVIHNEASIGELKTLSAKKVCRKMNSLIEIETYSDGLTPGNAVEIVERYDAVIDASDNAPTRYLINDACVVTGRPLVSGAAVGTDGQLTVYHYGQDGPCYRCLFPKAPPTGACSKCSEAGVLGPVPGTVGVLQALEAIKIITEVGEVLSRRLLLFDFLRADFRSVKLRQRSPECIACGPAASLSRFNIASYDYEGFTGQAFTEDPLPQPLSMISAENRIRPAELLNIMRQETSSVLIDVRPRAEFDICHLKEAHSFPMTLLHRGIEQIENLSRGGRDGIVVVCRRGNDSQLAVRKFKEAGIEKVKDLIGGLDAWRDEIDNGFFKY